MNSYGEILRNARESRNLTFDTVAREISIDKRYLQGLENEENTAFPGEAYLIGFLKNYASYLDLDSEFLLKLYHNKNLQETPTPVELLKKKKSRVLPIVLITSLALLLFGGGTFVFFFFFYEKPSVDEDEVLLSKNQKIKKYELSNQKFMNRVYKGDQLYVPTSDGRIVLTVKDTLESFGLDTPAGVFYTDLAEEAEYDINGDGTSDLIVYVSDISMTDESRGAEVSLLLRHGVVLESRSENIPSVDEIQSKHSPVVIHEDNRAYPFTLNATFRGSCVFRYKVDNNSTVETYYSNGETFTSTAQNGIRIWISNSNAVKFTLIADTKSYDLEIGKAGQVLVEDVKWIKDTDGRYKVAVIELD